MQMLPYLLWFDSLSLEGGAVKGEGLVWCGNGLKLVGMMRRLVMISDIILAICRK